MRCVKCNGKGWLNDSIGVLFGPLWPMIRWIDSAHDDKRGAFTQRECPRCHGEGREPVRRQAREYE